jgi:amidase
MRLPALPTAAVLSTVLTSASLRAQAPDVLETTISATHSALDRGSVTCRALVQAYLDRIAAYDQRGPALNAIQTINPRALAEADSLDQLRRRPGAVRGPLHCVPVLVKDQIETKGIVTTYGSALFRTFVPTRDATAVARLKAAGAIILAKTTMGEFAQRYVSSAAGVIRNAYDPTRNPSGSSGGSASGVAANFGLVGIGEDTGGSIRGPAAVSSLVGLRPTLQLVSRFGMLPANPTQDTMGPMTRTVADAARVLDVLVGYDRNDPITAWQVGRTPPTYLTALTPTALRGMRIGVIRIRRDTVSTARDTASAPDSAAARRDSVTRVAQAEFAKVRPLFERAIADLRRLGAVVVDSLQVPVIPGRRVSNDFETEEATNAYFAQHPNAPVKTLREMLLAGVINPTRARAMIDYVGRTTRDADYLLVLQQREAMRTALLALMAEQQVDALVYMTYDAPTTVIPADVLTNPRARDDYGRGDNRGLSPTLGWPALTVPAGFTAEGLPVGLEFLGRPFSEAQLLGAGYAYEQGTRHRRPPPTTPALSGPR